jgi:hypothetical protein
MLFWMLVVGAVALSGEAASRDGVDRSLLSILTEEDLRAEPFQCDCEFYRGNNAIGNTVFATRRHGGVAFVKIDGTVTRLAPVRVPDLGCKRGQTYQEEWSGDHVRVRLQFRPSSRGEEACWYQGRLTVETDHRSEAVSVAGSCGC